MGDSHFDLDSPIRMAAFEQVKKLSAVYTHIPAGEIRKGFSFEGKRIPLVNPQRGIFRPKEMKFLLSIRTVFPKTSARVRYEDQIDIHRKIFENLESVDYAFMGTTHNRLKFPIGVSGVDSQDRKSYGSSFSCSLSISLSLSGFTRNGSQPWKRSGFSLMRASVVLTSSSNVALGSSIASLSPFRYSTEIVGAKNVKICPFDNGITVSNISNFCANRATGLRSTVIRSPATLKVLGCNCCFSSATIRCLYPEPNVIAPRT